MWVQQSACIEFGHSKGILLQDCLFKAGVLWKSQHPRAIGRMDELHLQLACLIAYMAVFGMLTESGEDGRKAPILKILKLAGFPFVLGNTCP